jgi:uncharacterized membrane protein
LDIGTLNSNNNIGGNDLLLSLVFHFSFVEYKKKRKKEKKEKGMEKGALLHK